MSPNLKPGDRVLAMRGWPAGWLRKGQIVVLSRSHAAVHKQRLFEGTLYIKRIIGLGGETVEGTPHSLPLVGERMQHGVLPDQARQSWHIPEGQVFVRGDHHASSRDSTSWGPVPVQQILGVVVMKLPSRATATPPTLDAGSGLSEGQDAPPFTTQTLDGETVTLATYDRHPLLLVFFLVAPPFQSSLARCLNLASKAASAGVTLVLVSDRDREETQVFLTELHTSLPVLLAPRSSSSFLADYHIHAFPSYCFINEQGKVLASGLVDHEERVWQAVMEARRNVIPSQGEEPSYL